MKKQIEAMTIKGIPIPSISGALVCGCLKSAMYLSGAGTAGNVAKNGSDMSCTMIAAGLPHQDFENEMIVPKSIRIPIEDGENVKFKAYDKLERKSDTAQKQQDLDMRYYKNEKTNLISTTTAPLLSIFAYHSADNGFEEDDDPIDRSSHLELLNIGELAVLTRRCQWCQKECGCRAESSTRGTGLLILTTRLWSSKC